MRRRMLAMLVTTVLLAASCGDDGADDTAATGDSAASRPPAGAPAGDEDGADAADLQLATTGLGEVVVDAEGMTLYLFVPDGQGDSTCYDQCATNWPPTGEVATVGPGLDAALIGTTTRTDGEVQATYNGWPLYRFANDAAAGDTNGQGLNDVWYVIDAEGNAIRPEAAPDSAPSY